MANRQIEISTDPGKEIKEISGDFLQPMEVLREALANAYDAGAEHVCIRAIPENDSTGRRILTIDISDDGCGMDLDGLKGFFGLGVSHKPRIPGRAAIGYKGHGTKIYYRALDIYMVTRLDGGELLYVEVKNARETVLGAIVPAPEWLSGKEAEDKARERDLQVPLKHGTAFRLKDFTPDSMRLINEFQRNKIENYLRWFSVFGSFQYIVENVPPTAPFELRLQGIDDRAPSLVEYGFPWPKTDQVQISELKKKDDRRPFNFFVKRFSSKGHNISGGYQIDIAACFEGKRGRVERDSCIYDRTNRGALYHEEERYGLWLCKNHIPIEMHSEWLMGEKLLTSAYLEPKRALVLVNCDDLQLTANRGSVGNSQASLIDAIREEVLDFLVKEVEDDSDYLSFLEEYEEDKISRARENDKKALERRIRRFNDKKLCRIEKETGEILEFMEPGREITFFGVISKLEIWDPTLLKLDILDYDDHKGLDLLIRRGTDVGNLLSADQIAYVELKHTLEANLNHAFSLLHAIVCWDIAVREGNPVTDSTNVAFTLRESSQNGVTYTHLSPSPSDKTHKHNVQVVVVKRLLEETRKLQLVSNPRPVNGKKRTSAR